jgi:VWFA-related protein
MWFLIAWFAFFGLQTPLQEVRIRSAVYAPQPATIAVQSNLVELGATVRDKHGQFASGLQAADFEVLDKGVPQTIQVFSEQKAPNLPEPNLPEKSAPAAPVVPEKQASGAPSTTAAAPASAAQSRSIALFIDDTHTENYGVQKSKEAVGKLIGNGLHPDDRVGIFTGSGSVTQEFTSDHDVLLKALARVQPHPHIGLKGMGECPRMDPFEAYVINEHLDLAIQQQKVAEVCNCCNACCPTALGMVRSTAAVLWSQWQHNSFDVLGVLHAVVRHLAAEPESRVLILVSPGFPTPKMENRKDAIVEAALRFHIVINSLDAEGLVAGIERPGGPFVAKRSGIGLRQELFTEFMSDISAATGGQLILNSNDFMGNIRKLALPPEVSYLLAFSPTKEPDGNYHELKVRLRNHSGFQVESRPGYYATVVPKPPETVQQRIDREVLSSETLNELPATVHVSSANGEGGQITIDVNIKIDASHLKFVDKDDRQVQQLTYVTLLEDGQGHVITGKQAVMDLALTPGKLAEMRADGIKAETTFTAPKGAYQVREIIREVVENHWAISNTTVEFPLH